MPENLPRTVFVVDDEQVIASTLVAILNASGFKAIGFTNPLIALEAARTVQPSLLITDVVMPEMNGVELAIQLKAIWPDCRVLLFSGQAATSELLSSTGQGHAFELLLKPVHPLDLLAAIRKG